MNVVFNRFELELKIIFDAQDVATNLIEQLQIGLAREYFKPSVENYLTPTINALGNFLENSQDYPDGFKLIYQGDNMQAGFAVLWIVKKMLQHMFAQTQGSYLVENIKIIEDIVSVVNTEIKNQSKECEGCQI